MAAVLSAVNVHVHPGRYAELFEALKTLKKIVERTGGTFTLNRQAIGPQPGNVVGLSRYADWGGYAKLRSDPEFVRLLETMRNNSNPPADIVASSVYEEVVL
jgi:hypothetical protein